MRKYSLESWQGDFVKSEARFPAMVSAWGTGKTLCGILKVLRACESYPENLWVIFRKEFTDLRDSTIKDFMKYTGLHLNSSREVHLKNGSIIMFRHTEEMNNIQNINLGGFLMEQAEEEDNADKFTMLRGRLRREGVPHQGCVIANTRGHNWIYDWWKMKKLDNSFLVEATTFDNQHNLPFDFLEDLKRLKLDSPIVYNRFVTNSWSDADMDDVVIPYHLIEKCQNTISPWHDPWERRVTVADVASFGGDETVIYDMINSRIVDQEIYTHHDLMDTCGRLIFHARKNRSSVVSVDKVGEGAGVCSRLEEVFASDPYTKVLGYDSRLSPPHDFEKTFGNYRSYSWFMALNKYFKELQIKLPPDEKLFKQLSNVKFKFRSNGRIILESKDEIKKRMGWSPDRADALIIGLDALEKVKPVMANLTRVKSKGYVPERFRAGILN